MGHKVINSNTIFRQILSIARPANFTLPLIAILVGYVLAGGSLQQPPFTLYILLASAFLLHTGITITNDLDDRTIDKDNNVKTIITTGSARVRKGILVVAIACLLLSICLPFLLPLNAAVIIWVSAVVSLAYNHRPLQLSHRPISSIVVLGIIYGAMPLLLGYLLVLRTPPIIILVIAVFWGIGRAGLSLLKDFKDMNGDKKHNKQTFLLRFGATQTKIASIICAAISLPVLIATIYPYIAPAYQLLFIVTMSCITILLLVYRRALFTPHSDTNVIFHRLLQVQLLFDIGILVWLMLS